MKTNVKRKQLLIGVCVVMLILAAAMVACQPHTTQGQSEVSLITGDNQISRGDYVPYDPEAHAAETGGAAIAGSEEDELQQERIAGGAVGAIVSVNLPILSGITDHSPGTYSLSYGMYLQAPFQGHTDNGSDCQICHREGGAGAAQPKSHLSSALTNEDCASCHASVE